MGEKKPAMMDENKLRCSGFWSLNTPPTKQKNSQQEKGQLKSTVLLGDVLPHRMPELYFTYLVHPKQQDSTCMAAHFGW